MQKFFLENKLMILSSPVQYTRDKETAEEHDLPLWKWTWI